MSGYSEEWLGNTDTTSTERPIEPEVDNPGVLEIYRRMMAIELFQTQYGGWVSNLPLHIKVLMAALLVTLLTAIAGGIYLATVNWDRATNWMDGTYQNLLESVTPFLDGFTQEEEDESHPKIKTIKQHNCEFESDL